MRHLHNKIENLEYELKLFKRATRGYSIGRAKRDVEIMRLWEKRKNLTEISKEVGLTRQGVKKALDRLDALDI